MNATMTELQECLRNLIAKAKKVERSDDAMRFSQAAQNIANAMCAYGASLKNIAED